MHRLALLLCLLLVSAFAQAAAPALADRSPIRSGLWWDPAHSGHGFDLHVSGRGAFGAWFTYRADGTPVWYTLEGAFDADGTLEAALLEHRWSGDGYGGAVQAGRVTLHREHADGLALQWRIGDDAGTWALEPFPLDGSGVDVDHSGAWFDPARSGYGLSVAEQGDWLALALYAYDASGRATWMFGHNSGKGRDVELARMGNGACPACAARVPVSVEQVDASVTFDAETSLRLRIATPPAGIAPAFVPASQPMRMLSVPASLRPADYGLARFGDRGQLKQHLAVAYQQRLQQYGGGPSIDFSAPPTRTVSTTNLVEAGVDEADALKSDGRYVYTFASNALGQRQPQLRIAEIVGDGPALTVHPTVNLGIPEVMPNGANHALYVAGDDLVTLVSNYAITQRPGPAIWEGPLMWTNGRFRVDLFDRRDPVHPVRRWGATIDGVLMTSRRIGDQLYLVHRTARMPDGFRAYAYDDQSRAANRALIEATPLDALLPRIAVDGSAPAPLIDAQNVVLPPTGARHVQPEFACVTRIDLRAPERRETIAVLGGVEAIYASTRHLYIATTRYSPVPDTIEGVRWDSFAATDVHQIALGDAGMQIAATGSVDGVVGRDFERAPFRFSEADGRLRLVTVGRFGESGRNRVTVLEPSALAPGKLRIVGELPNAQRPEALGKPNEQVYGTRFVGDRLYAVTFLRTDPLYVIDLSDAADPRIAGEVELPGFSDYLHPVGDGLLLGVGLDALPPAPGSTVAQFQGLKLALFDVTDPSRPRVQDALKIGERGTDSALLRNHHALAALQLAPDRLRVALPVRVHGKPSAIDDNAAYQTWTHSGLYTIDVQGTGSSARLVQQAPLITHSPPAPADWYYDDAQFAARSLLMPSGAIYVENGRFWHSAGVPVGPR